MHDRSLKVSTIAQECSVLKPSVLAIFHDCLCVEDQFLLSPETSDSSRGAGQDSVFSGEFWTL
jgi:hypothetical protein